MDEVTVEYRFQGWAKIRTFLHNSKSFHHRLMANYLRKRNWVAFYLEPEHRICNKDCCWLKLYESEQEKQ